MDCRRDLEVRKKGGLREKPGLKQQGRNLCERKWALVIPVRLLGENQGGKWQK